jgi:hypothetical protein
MIKTGHRWRLKKNLVVTWLAASLLVVGTLTQALKPKGTGDSVELPDLTKAVPAILPGWEVKDLPLGDTEALTASVASLLKFDAYIYREYRRGPRTFTVYVAYWTPGKIPPQLVEAHTPDICWPGSGWFCEQRENNVDLGSGPTALGKGAQRVFSMPGRRIYVQFWHLVGGVQDDFSTRWDIISYATRWSRDMMRSLGGHGPREQFFIRIASAEPLETIAAEAGAVEILQRLRAVAIDRRPRSRI